MTSGSDLLVQVLANTAAKWAVYVSLAIGFGLLYRALRVFHVAYALLIGAPPYIVLGMMQAGAPQAAAVVGAIALTGLFAILLELGVFGPLHRRGAGTEGGMIASLGAYTALQSLLGATFGFGMIRLPLLPDAVWEQGFLRVASAQFAAVGLGLVAVVALGFLERLPVGVRLRALGDSPTLLQLTGARIHRLRMGAWLIAAAFAALAGLLASSDTGVDPRSGLQLFLAGSVAVFLGGVNRPAGWILAALALALVENLAPLVVEAKWSTTAVYAVALILLAARPSGLVVTRVRGVHG